MSGRDLGIVALVVVGVLILLPLLGGMSMMMGPGMMGSGMMGSGMMAPGMGPGGGGRWGGGWGMPFFGGIFWLSIIVGIVLVVSSYARRNGASAPAGTVEPPLDILKRRLAKGEIAREEYDALKKELS